MKPLESVTVLEFCQYLSGPSATLRLADLGARVIKVERKQHGDGCRNLTIANATVDEQSLLFKTINRNKQSFEVDLKSEEDLEKVKRLIGRADVLVENFRPGIMNKLGLDYETLKKTHKKLVYASISGYGDSEQFRNTPGQDLLVQSMTGATQLNGNDDMPPTPFGLAIADILSGNHLVQGILSALFHQQRTGEGSLVEVSMVESMIDLQFEVLTTYLNNGQKPVERSNFNNAHAYIGAPYGIYQTQDGFIALAMCDLMLLGKLIECSELLAFSDNQLLFTERDNIKAILAKHLVKNTSQHWLSILKQEDIWCAPVYDWKTMFSQPGFQSLELTQNIETPNKSTFSTTRCPIRINGKILLSDIDAPKLGQDNASIDRWLEK